MPNNNPSGHNQYTNPENRSQKSRRGFASMDAQMQREIASKGGQSQGKENNPGNFANDREKAREAGRKGGEAHGANR
ncbi:MAG TPA: KGG domain-containing protein [Steroidobacteraceae bacterium]|nr:KGG domain-containing protein [Steroidobacteraceae bacterium]